MSYEHLELLCGFPNCLLGTIKRGDSSCGQFLGACQRGRCTRGSRRGPSSSNTDRGRQICSGFMGLIQDRRKTED